MSTVLRAEVLMANAILRPANPALSLASDSDNEDYATELRLYGKPCPEELSSPPYDVAIKRHSAISSFTVPVQDSKTTASDSRSQSAPPMPEENTINKTKDPVHTTTSALLQKVRVGFSFDMWRENGLYQQAQQQRHGNHPYLGPSSSSEGSPSARDPEILENLGLGLKTLFATSGCAEDSDEESRTRQDFFQLQKKGSSNSSRHNNKTPAATNVTVNNMRHNSQRGGSQLQQVEQEIQIPSETILIHNNNYYDSDKKLNPSQPRVTTSSLSVCLREAHQVHPQHQQQQQPPSQVGFATSTTTTPEVPAPKHEGGLLQVLRPNPVNTVDFLSLTHHQRANSNNNKNESNEHMSAGIVATAPRIASTASFAAAPPIQQQQPPPPSPSPANNTTALPVRPLPAITEPEQQQLQQQQQQQQLQSPQPQHIAVSASATQPEPWCNQATIEAAAEQQERVLRNEKREAEQQKQQQQEKEARRLAELKRKQEAQCNFPDSYSNMNSGRNSAVEDEEEKTAALQNRVAEDNLPVTHQIQPPGPQHSHHSHRRNTRTSSASSAQHHSHQNHHHHANEHNNNNNDESSSHRRGGGRNGGSSNTPVFERLVTDEVRELQTYARMVENQDMELDKMRKYQKDLEKRLQDEAMLHERLEATLEVRERDWLLRFEELEREIKRLHGVVKSEESKNRLLLDQVRKKDSDIQGMLKKKYDHHEESNTRSVRNYRAPAPGEQRGDRAFAQQQQQKVEARFAGGQLHKSPNRYLWELGSAEQIRERNTKHLLMDFFGM